MKLIVNDYFVTITSLTVESLLSATHRYLLLLTIRYFSHTTNMHVWAQFRCQSITMYFWASSDGLWKLLFCDGSGVWRGASPFPSL